MTMLTPCLRSRRLHGHKFFCKYLGENEAFHETVLACSYKVQVEFFVYQKEVQNLVTLSTLRVIVISNVNSYPF